VVYKLRWWIVLAAVIWIFVKLPQEWWIHVAQLDFTEFVADHSWAAPLLVVLFVVAALVFWFAIRPRLRPADHPWQLAADPLPEEMDTAAERASWHATYGAVRSPATLEKVVLVGLISVIYAQTLPGVRASNLELFIGVAIIVVVNAAAALFVARRAVTIENALALFGSRLLFNIVFLVLAEWVLGTGDDLDTGDTLFFLMLISLITTLHDRFLPVLETRRAAASEAPAAQG
jgi:chromate transport protein ChrA